MSPNEIDSICIDAENIIWKYRSSLETKVAFSEIKIIAFYTNESGPWGADHFLVLVTKTQIVNISAETFTKDDFFEHFVKKFKITTALVNSTQFASEIVYPEVLKGKPIYTFQNRKAETLMGKIKLYMFPKVDLTCTEEVNQYLQNF